MRSPRLTSYKACGTVLNTLEFLNKGQVALEDNFRFVQDKSDLKSASDKKFVRKATVALKNKICEQNITYINLMICCLLLMQNLRAQNILVTRCIRRQRNRYRRRAPYYWTLPRPVESWFEIHYTDRTIPGDYFRRLLRMNRESFDLLLNVIRNRLTRQNTVLQNCLTPE